MTPLAPDLVMRGYDLVVIGSSAGGIEALSTLVASLPVGFGAALVIAQHLDPTHVSHLGEILARKTSLPVRVVAGIEQEPLEPGVIYVVPADRDVEILDHHVRLRPHGEHRSTPSVNRLFSSAARSHGERLICVVLTGAGSDGASGARDVKAAGGTVVIENPATAAYASMPQSLALSLVDLVVDLPQIGPLLADLVAGSYTPSRSEADSALPELLQQVREHTGVDFSTYKPPTILRRLQRRLAATHIDTLSAYLTYLPAHPDEYQKLLASFLIQVTEFFRDPEFFATLRDEVLPDVLARARAEGRPVRVWSAGCATGEEAYSLAILLAELVGNDLNDVPVRIFATDVDADAIAFARRGVYPASALATVPAHLIAQAFTVVEGAYEIVPSIRELIIFGQHDLGVRAPFPAIDLVLCRNVLIYFTPELQGRVLQLFAFALREGGFLALGKAETPASFAAFFVPVSSTSKLYRRQGARVVVPPPRLSSLALAFNPPLLNTRRANARRSVTEAALPQPAVRDNATTSEYVGSLLLSSSIGIVVVDRRYDIQAINRAAQQLLGIYRPALGEDLIHAVASELAQPLRAAIDTAIHAARAPDTSPDAPAVSMQQGGQLEATVAMTSGDRRALHLVATATDTTVLLQITDVTARMQTQQAVEAAMQHAQQIAANQTAVERRATPSQQQRIWATERSQLREEMARLKGHLERLSTANQTVRLANDEMARANLSTVGLNEDLVVRNEELQASSEEIKTLNEELQATNEELETLNEEMEATVEELRATNDDVLARTDEVHHLATLREEQRKASEARAVELTAIMQSMSDAMLVVNQAGDVSLTNAAYSTLFGDAGMEWVCEDEDGRSLPAAETPQQRIVAGLPFRIVFTQPLPHGKRRWLEATGEPILNAGVRTGSVLTVRDITDRSLRRLQDEFLALAAHEMRSPLTSIKAAAQLLDRAMGASDEPLRLKVRTITRQSVRLQRFIDDLADVSRLQHGKLHLSLVPVDCKQIAALTIESFGLTVQQPPIVLEAAGMLTILADALRVEQILTNLLSNASKYATHSPQIVVRLRQVGQNAEMQVQDSGPGIAAADLPHLFDRFYQVSAGGAHARGGLGLGLYLTRELVHAQGGTIEVHSTLGQGTTFTIHFPLQSVPVSSALPAGH